MSDDLYKHHPLSPNGIDNEIRNHSSNTCLTELLQARCSRRDALKGGFAMATTAFISSGSASAAPAFALGFRAVAKSLADTLAVPEGYRADVLFRLGDPIDDSVPDFRNDGGDSAASFTHRAGDHHDGMHYFGLDPTGERADAGHSRRGLLCVNHENITQVFLHGDAEVAAGLPVTARVSAQIDKEVNAHGVSVIEVVRDGERYRVNTRSRFNRRLTAASAMELCGPARGSALLATRFSPAGTRTRGTLNNCANGHTPWGTYLTCEENWAGYFKRPASSSLEGKARVAQERYFGASASQGSYGWANPVADNSDGEDRYRRWDITPAAGATQDYRHAANGMGWVVEIDPFNPTSVPRKRTALGRFGHEGAMLARVMAGRPLVWYMGDDARNEYLYKYVSRRNWDAADVGGGLSAGNRYLDDGDLYVARFDAAGTGTWIALSLAHPAVASHATYAFADQADVLIHCRLAADAVGATPMDRPEWTGVHPVTGDVYVTLTNNSLRGKAGGNAPDAANPRYYDDGEGNKGNPNGHIIRIHESGGDPAATRFHWDIYLFGAEAGLDGHNINLSGLTDDNDFSSPDGLWFSQAKPGLMWLQTDDSAYTDVSNCMMLAALPGHHGDGRAVNIANKSVPANGGRDLNVATLAGRAATPATLRRFLVGPKGCEITGVTETPDGQALFVNIQHPGEDTRAADLATPARFDSHWPDGGRARPRSATVVITRKDGGPIGG